jgi:hypothetical protein
VGGPALSGRLHGSECPAEYPQHSGRVNRFSCTNSVDNIREAIKRIAALPRD